MSLHIAIVKIVCYLFLSEVWANPISIKSSTEHQSNHLHCALISSVRINARFEMQYMCLDLGQAILSEVMKFIFQSVVLLQIGQLYGKILTVYASPNNHLVLFFSKDCKMTQLVGSLGCKQFWCRETTVCYHSNVQWLQSGNCNTACIRHNTQ